MKSSPGYPEPSNDPRVIVETPNGISIFDPREESPETLMPKLLESLGRPPKDAKSPQREG